MTDTELINAHYADRPWHERAAAHLAVASPALAPKLAPYVDEDGGIRWHDMRGAANRWSSHERDLVWICCSLADETPESQRANMGRLLSPGMDAANVEAVLEAVRVALEG